VTQESVVAVVIGGLFAHSGEENIVDDKKLYPGDYLRAEPGTADHRVWSETGCTCVLLTSTRDALL
jgi:hypothetical protein